jgi:hypothetical protein
MGHRMSLREIVPVENEWSRWVVKRKHKQDNLAEKRRSGESEKRAGVHGVRPEAEGGENGANGAVPEGDSRDASDEVPNIHSEDEIVITAKGIGKKAPIAVANEIV